MKKSLVLMAMAGVALASCVNEIADVQQQQVQKVKITFDSPVLYDNGSGSRATVFGEIGPHTVGTNTYTYPTAESFKIFAILYEGNYPGWATNTTKAEFDGNSLVYDSNVDGWAPKQDGRYYYWPDNQKMAFAALSPADLTVEGIANVNVGVTPTYGADGLKIQNFQVMPDASKQYDLMFSKRIVDQTAANMQHGADYYSGVPITFQHALSSIRFSLQNTSSATVVIQKIELSGIADIGSFSENIKTDNGEYTRGQSGNVAPAWTGQTKSAENIVYHVFEGDVTAPYEAQYLSNLLDATLPTYNPDNIGTFNQLLVLPQTITADVKAYVEYTIDGVLNKKTVLLKDALKVSKVGEDTVTDEKLSFWEMGSRYTYRLWYSEKSASKDRIYFAPNSEGWVDAGAYRIEL